MEQRSECRARILPKLTLILLLLKKFRRTEEDARADSHCHSATASGCAEQRAVEAATAAACSASLDRQVLLGRSPLLPSRRAQGRSGLHS
jgi:hypothetical protein